MDNKFSLHSQSKQEASAYKSRFHRVLHVAGLRSLSSSSSSSSSDDERPRRSRRTAPIANSYRRDNGAERHRSPSPHSSKLTFQKDVISAVHKSPSYPDVRHASERLVNHNLTGESRSRSPQLETQIIRLKARVASLESELEAERTIGTEIEVLRTTVDKLRHQLLIERDRAEKEKQRAEKERIAKLRAEDALRELRLFGNGLLDHLYAKPTVHTPTNASQTSISPREYSTPLMNEQLHSHSVTSNPYRSPQSSQRKISPPPLMLSPAKIQLEADRIAEAAIARSYAPSHTQRSRSPQPALYAYTPTLSPTRLHMDAEKIATQVITRANATATTIRPLANAPSPALIPPVLNPTKIQLEAERIAQEAIGRAQMEARLAQAQELSGALHHHHSSASPNDFASFTTRNTTFDNVSY